MLLEGATPLPSSEPVSYSWHCSTVVAKKWREKKDKLDVTSSFVLNMSFLHALQPCRLHSQASFAGYTRRLHLQATLGLHSQLQVALAGCTRTCRLHLQAALALAGYTHRLHSQAALIGWTQAALASAGWTRTRSLHSHLQAALTGCTHRLHSQAAAHRLHCSLHLQLQVALAGCRLALAGCTRTCRLHSQIALPGCTHRLHQWIKWILHLNSIGRIAINNYKQPVVSFQ